ncbi:MAG: hypothetical protein R2879_07705 [Saprospiraceae bacterium]
MDSRRLKDLEEFLKIIILSGCIVHIWSDPSKISSLKSAGNGDYDALIENGKPFA